MANNATLLEDYRVNKGLTQEQIAGLIDISTRTYQNIIKTGEIKRVDILERVIKLLAGNTQNISRETSKGAKNSINEPEQSYLQKRLDKKNNGNPYLVPFVDVPAQAGYTKAYDHVDYIQTLKHYPILPDVDPHGAIWRYFQIKGDSMENPKSKDSDDPGLKDGETILCSQVPKEDWKTFSNIYTYVVVTDTDLWIKDVDREMLADEGKWVLISRNQHYKPFAVDIQDVRQLWILRRHVRNAVPKTRMYDLSAIKKQLKK